MTTWLKKHWLPTAAMCLAAALMLWAGGCAPRVRSPLNNSRKLTRPQLIAELNYTIALFEAAAADLEEQERIRKLILTNALAIANAGTLNPLAILTAIAGAYGVTRAGGDTVKTIKKHKSTNKTPIP